MLCTAALSIRCGPQFHTERMKAWSTRIGFGIILWTVTYAASIPLLPLSQSDPSAFKSLVIALSTVLSSIITVVYFQSVPARYLREAGIVAITWVLTNWMLDLVALLPFTHQTLPQYFLEIGLSYIGFMAPIIAVGYLLDKKRNTVQ